MLALEKIALFLSLGVERKRECVSVRERKCARLRKRVCVFERKNEREKNSV